MNWAKVTLAMREAAERENDVLLGTLVDFLELTTASHDLNDPETPACDECTRPYTQWCPAWEAAQTAMATWLMMKADIQ